MKQIILKKDNIIYGNIFVAITFFERLKGLMFIDKNNSFGLLFKNCNSIHTCFMKFNLDVYCLDRDFKVIRIYKDLKPFRFTFPNPKIKNILELPSNTNNNICINDMLSFIE